MAFEQVKDSITNIPSELKDLAKSNYEYYRLSFFRLLVKGASGFLKVFIIGVCMLLLSFFLATAGAFALGELLGSYALGFACVGGFFLLVALLVVLFRKYIIDKPLLLMLSEFYFDDNDEDTKPLIQGGRSYE